MLLPNVYIDGELWNYFVSRQGRVYSLNYNHTGKIKELKPCITIIKNYKQPRVTLCKNNKTKRVIISRLVAQAYIPNPENKPEVDHIDRNPLNNDISNLRWVTKSENIHNREMPKNIKGSKGVRCIETGEIFPSISEASRQRGCYKGNIANCCRGLRKTAYGLHWEYV